MSKKNGNYMIDILPGIVSSLFSLFYLSQVPKIRVFKGLGATPINNRFVPYLWGGILLLLGICLIIRGLIKMMKLRAAGVKGEKFSLAALISDKREVIASFVCLTLYVGLLEKIGFVIMTTIYTFVQILILTPPDAKWKKNIIPAAIVAVITGILLYYIFRVHLNVLLPAGLLEGIFGTAEEAAAVAQ